MFLNEEMEQTRSLLYKVLDTNNNEDILMISRILDDLITRYYVEVYKRV